MPFDYKGQTAVEVVDRVPRTAMQRPRPQTKPEPQREADFWSSYVGPSAKMREIENFLRQIASSDCPVLVTGPTGAGKEVVSRTIHANSHRRYKPFVAVNCAAIPPELCESELFGHVKGAFTSASNLREGKITAADGGTLFLDEVSDMDLAAQAKILRALSEGEVSPVGSEKTKRVDVRLVAATNRNLNRLVASGKFREDLFYRLGVLTVNMPALRDRPDDILPLATNYLSNSGKAIRLSSNARAMLLDYHWPGNVRELYAVLDAALALGGSHVLQDDALQAVLARRSKAVGLGEGDGVIWSALSWRDAQDEFRRLYWEELFQRCEGNISKMARRSRTPRSNAYRILQELKLLPPLIRKES